MIQRLTLFIIFLILAKTNSYSQIAKDTAICLTRQQVKIINLAFNQLDKMTALNTEKDTLIQKKDAQIAMWKKLEEVRATMLIEANKELEVKNTEIRKLRYAIWAYRVGVIGAVLVTYLLVK